MSFDSHVPFGIALLDYFNGDTAATLTVYDEIGQKRERPVSLFFREPSEFPAWEKEALALCRGRILDIGACVGRHSLVLQELGFSVCAVEVVPQCVEIMRRRGVRDVHCADVFTFQADPFDTVLCLMNGVTVAGGFAGLAPFLTHVRRLTKTDGQLLIDSMDVREQPELTAILERAETTGRYVGEMELQIEYKGIKGEPFRELYVEPEILSEVSSRCGWTFRILLREKSRYLAQLIAKQPS